eukprot:GHVL01040134.1.p1 GENE.GHVL01040134.1~~GHVL01040134.1.p1  ORF type:complete len:111 (+),score=34.96 GHVL01040134.1:59-391(+)
MRYVAAYMLAALGTKGDASPTAADVEKILSSVGIEAEADKVKKIVSELKGKNLEELIEAGTKKLASVPSGGAAPAAAPAAAAAAPAEAKKEEKKAETESEDDDMGFGLFD